MLYNLKIKFSSLALLAFLALLGTPARSQTTEQQYADTLAKLKSATPEKRARMQSDIMKSKLSLTDIQYRQVSVINLDYARRIEPILRGDDNQFSKYRQAKPLLDEKDVKLKTVMTADQFKKYGEVKQQLMDQARKVMSK